MRRAFSGSLQSRKRKRKCVARPRNERLDTLETPPVDQSALPQCTDRTFFGIDFSVARVRLRAKDVRGSGSSLQHSRELHCHHLRAEFEVLRASSIRMLPPSSGTNHRVGYFRECGESGLRENLRRGPRRDGVQDRRGLLHAQLSRGSLRIDW